MQILILHDVQSALTLRRTTFNQTFCLLKYAPAHEYVLHCHGRPLTTSLLERPFDVIVLDTTFLCHRWSRPRAVFDQLRRDYEFVRRSNAVKVAFPQDDYDHSAILDEWLSDWGVNVVFSPLASFRDILYPKTSRAAEVLECLTGYVDVADEAMLARWRRPFGARSIDVGYRAKDLPKYFGRLGRLKGEIGSRFVRSLGPGTRFRLDIATGLEATLLGADWLRFLGDCKFTLGTISGSSLLDPDGEIQDCVRAYETAHPGAGFEEVESKCFAGQDGVHEFAALGPRHLEAATAKSCQILVSSKHWSPLEPGRHFIALDEDCSNIDDVVAQMRDVTVEERIEACYDLVVRSGHYGYPDFVRRISEAIDRCAGSADARAACASATAVDAVESLVADQRITRLLFVDEKEHMPEQNALLRHEIDRLREELGRRTGRAGALREFFHANEYRTTAEAANLGAKAPLSARLFFCARDLRNAVRSLRKSLTRLVSRR